MNDSKWMRMKKVMQRMKELEQREMEQDRLLKALQERLDAMEDGKERLPIGAFLDYAERYYTPEQNDRAKVVKELLGDLFTNISTEDRKRLRMLGCKERSIAKSVFDISGNKEVNIGGK